MTQYWVFIRTDMSSLTLRCYTRHMLHKSWTPCGIWNAIKTVYMIVVSGWLGVCHGQPGTTAKASISARPWVPLESMTDSKNSHEPRAYTLARAHTVPRKYKKKKKTNELSRPGPPFRKKPTGDLYYLFFFFCLQRVLCNSKGSSTLHNSFHSIRSHCFVREKKNIYCRH